MSRGAVRLNPLIHSGDTTWQMQWQPQPPAGKRIRPSHKPLQPSVELAAVVGSSPLARPDVVSKMWDYIKSNNLQNPQNKREILADEKLELLRPTVG
jgi:chromatin remodeling complex protein RSC6